MMMMMMMMTVMKTSVLTMLAALLTYESFHFNGKMNLIFYAPGHFQCVGVGGGEGGAYSITAVCTYVHPVPYVTQMVSVQYLLKRLVYLIQILYTGILS